MAFYFDSTVNFLALVLSLIAVMLAAITLLYAIGIRDTENEIKINQEKEESEQTDRVIMSILNKYKNFIINLKEIRRFQRWIESESQMAPGDIVAPIEYNLEWNINNSIRRAYTLIEFVEYNLPYYPEADNRIFEWKSVIVENTEKLQRDKKDEHSLLEIEHAVGIIIGFLENYKPKSIKYQNNLQKYLDFYREHTKFIVKVHGKQAKDIIHPDYTGY